MKASEHNLLQVIFYQDRKSINFISYFTTKYDYLHSVHPHLSAEGVEPPTKFTKRGVSTGSQFLEGGCWERAE